MNLQEARKMLNIDKIASNGEGVVVAIIDTGCSTDHPDLRGHIIGGKCFINDCDNEGKYLLDEDNFCDNNGHGTHVAGIISAVAPAAGLLVFKGLGANLISLTSTISDAVLYAARWRGVEGEKVDIMSLSLSTSINNTLLHKAVLRALDNDILVVSAAGNCENSHTAPDGACYPGAYPGVVQVGACDDKFMPASFSSPNAGIDCMAPGVNVLSAWKDGGYRVLSGTSQAVPFTAGCAALILSYYRSKGRNLSRQQLYDELMKCTRDLGYNRYLQGRGIIDISGFTP